jgi:hypothetical protein
MRVEGFFRWYDLWVGAFWDTKTRVLYICPIPCFGIREQVKEPLNDL